MSFPDVFKALSDPVRREILTLLKQQGKMPAGEIAAEFELFSLAENVKIEPFDKRMFRLKNGSDRSVVIDEEVRELIGNGEPKAFEDLIRNDYME